MHSKATGGISSHVAHGRARRLVQDRRCVTIVVINLQPPACRTASEDEPWRFPRFPACFLLGAPLELPSPDKSCRHLLQMDMRSSSSLAVLIAPYAPQRRPPPPLSDESLPALLCTIVLPPAPLPQGILFSELERDASSSSICHASGHHPSPKELFAPSSSRRIPPRGRRRRRRP